MGGSINLESTSLVAIAHIGLRGFLLVQGGFCERIKERVLYNISVLAEIIAEHYLQFIKQVISITKRKKEKKKIYS